MGDDADLSDDLLAAAELMEAVARDRSLLDGLTPEEVVRFLNAAGNVFSPDVDARRQQTKARRRQEKAAKVRRDEDVLTETGIRRLRARPVFMTPNVFPPDQLAVEADARTGDEQHCYVCKRKYVEIHHFYDQLCPTCAEVSFAKRTETADLRGRVALLTGGRVKIGYQAGIKLLRSGASLIVTTRFPRDAALRYSREADADEWSDRLEVYGLDLRHTPSVEALCHHLSATHGRLDYIINNACQTVRRPPEFYRHMLELETRRPRPHAGGRSGAAGRRRRRAGAAPPRGRRRALAQRPRSMAWCRAPPWPSCRCSRRTPTRAPTSSRRAGSTRTSSRSTCGIGTRGG